MERALGAGLQTPTQPRVQASPEKEKARFQLSDDPAKLQELQRLERIIIQDKEYYKSIQGKLRHLSRGDVDIQGITEEVQQNYQELHALQREVVKNQLLLEQHKQVSFVERRALVEQNHAELQQEKANLTNVREYQIVQKQIDCKMRKMKNEISLLKSIREQNQLCQTRAQLAAQIEQKERIIANWQQELEQISALNQRLELIRRAIELRVPVHQLAQDAPQPQQQP